MTSKTHRVSFPGKGQGLARHPEPRLRQVVDPLSAALTRDDGRLAVPLGLSVHTPNDPIKTLDHHLGLQSGAEAIARWVNPDGGVARD